MHTNRFHNLSTASGPFSSVYFDDSHETEDAAKRLELELRDIRTRLEEQGASAKSLETVTTAFEQATPAVGRSGRAVVANEETVLLDEPLLRPPDATEARHSDLPYLVPVIEHGATGRTYLLVFVDHEGADLSVHHFGKSTVVSETLSGSDYPVHKAAGAETSGYGDPQPRAEEAMRRNVSEVAHRIDKLVAQYGPDPIFLVGETRTREELFGALSEHARTLTVELQVGARAAGADTDAIRAAVAEEFAKRRVAEIDDIAQRVRAELGRNSGLAAEGLDAVCDALRAGNVETLVMGDIADRTVLVGDEPTWVAVEAGRLSELGSSTTSTRRADEALPFATLMLGGRLVRVDERIAPTDGCAALLRHA
ncbi:hypothetical protein [Rhodococcus sp. NPDC058521]|uniref:Rv2629 family ribosome hibernation factor n=1 Tax=Rhodococcus sp. NPDC058521 TaxID=3346536 RepID=UPI00365172BC